MELLKKYKREIEYCTFCPRLCRFECPTAIAESNETYTPTGKMSLVYLVEIAKANPEKVKDAFYMCVDCKHCITPCLHKIDVPKVLIEARAKVYESGMSDQNIKKFAGLLEKYDHPYSHIMEDNLKEVVSGLYSRYTEQKKTKGMPTLAAPYQGVDHEKPPIDRARVLYFPGCTALRFYKDTVKGVSRLLTVLDIDFDIMDEPTCCGYPGYAAGVKDWFQKTAAKLKGTLDKYDTVISTCPTCINTFKNIYRRNGIELKANPMHILEFIAPKIKQLLKQTTKADAVVAYHDPCHLGRHLGDYDTPREIIDLIYEKRVEFQWSKEEANCCGGGGAVPLTNPDTSSKIGKKRMEEFKLTGADKLLTACPSCVRWLKKADERIEVIDIVDVLVKKLV